MTNVEVSQCLRDLGLDAWTVGQQVWVNNEMAHSICVSLVTPAYARIWANDQSQRVINNLFELQDWAINYFDL